MAAAAGPSSAGGTGEQPAPSWGCHRVCRETGRDGTAGERGDGEVGAGEHGGVLEEEREMPRRGMLEERGTGKELLGGCWRGGRGSKGRGKAIVEGGRGNTGNEGGGYWKGEGGGWRKQGDAQEGRRY